MSRSVVSAITDQAQSASRYPLSYAIIRDVRIRFLNPFTGNNEPWSQPSVPWGWHDGDALKTSPVVFQDSCVLNGIIRCAVDPVAGGVYVQWVYDPGDFAAWTTWVRLDDADPLQVPGIVADSGIARLFYMKSGVLNYIDSSDGLAWSGQTSTGTSYSDYCALAPISQTICYVAQATSNAVKLYRVDLTGSAQELPWRLFGSTEQPINVLSFDSISFFDTYKLDGAEYILITHGTGGQVYKARYLNGVFSPPQTILPTFNDDTNGMLAYRVSIINDGTRDVVWLTARIQRRLATQTVEFDTYLRSLDGWNWTHLTRNSFICQPAIGGKLEAYGNYLYYMGLTNVYIANKPYGVDGSDRVDLKAVITDDFMTGQVGFPSQGTAPQVELDLAAGKNYYLSGDPATVVKRGSDVWVYGGYKTPSAQYAMLDHAGIDSVKGQVANGQRQFGLTARDIAFKNLRTWVSPLFWDFRSQLKHQGTDELYSADGIGAWNVGAACPGVWSGAPFNPNGTDPGSDLVYAADGTHISLCRNFTASSPHWENITGTISGTIIDFCLDPWDTIEYSHNSTVLSVVYVCTDTGVYITKNAKTYSPTWEEIVPKATFEAVTGSTLDQFHNVRCTIAQQDLVYVQALSHVGSEYRMYVGVSQDMGYHWDWNLVAVITDFGDQHGFACSQYIPGNVYAGANGHLYRSTNFGGGWSSIGTFGTTGPSNIVLPYQSNPDDLTILVAGAA